MVEKPALAVHHALYVKEGSADNTGTELLDGVDSGETSELVSEMSSDDELHDGENVLSAVVES